MKQIERYILVRTAASTLMVFVALGAMVWLSQSLRQFNLVSANGQSIWTFLTVSSLLLPAMLSFVLPIALLIATIYTFTSLNTDSELVVINASGASQAVLLRPALVLGTVTALIVAAMSLHFTPMSLRAWQDMLSQVRSDILTNVMREGEFMQLGDGLTFHMSDRLADGTMAGIFLADDRGEKTSVTYLAERGGMIENPLGTFLVMGNGTIQQRSKLDGSISMIEFSSYAFDLTSFSSTPEQEQRALTAGERTLGYLFAPDPDDRYLREQPEKFRIEIHKRVTTPLYALVFALLPLAYLAQAQSSRQSRAVSIAGAVAAAAIIQVAGIVLPGLAEQSFVAFVAMYALPLAIAAGAIVLVLTGMQIRPPERVVAMAERIVERASTVAGGRSQRTG